MNNERPTARSVLFDTPAANTSQVEIDNREKQFFNQLVLRNGTLKTTFAGRLHDLDRICNKYLESSDGGIQLLDVAVSSGVTTYEWTQALDAANIDYSMDAFDLCVDASIKSLSNNFHVLCDSSGYPLQFEFYGRSIENTLGETILRKLRRVLPVTLLRMSYRLKSSGRSNAVIGQSVQLVTHYLRHSNRIRVFEYDIKDIDELPKTYDMIRAANILNLAYFDENFLRASLSKLKGRLNDDGYLVVVRTHSDNSNHGTILRKENNRLVNVERVGNGSEVEALALSV